MHCAHTIVDGFKFQTSFTPIDIRVLAHSSFRSVFPYFVLKLYFSFRRLARLDIRTTGAELELTAHVNFSYHPFYRQKNLAEYERGELILTYFFLPLKDLFNSSLSADENYIVGAVICNI